jgi:hypothetical protein
MPCNHKFIEDLNLERLDFEPTTLIVGTFNPEWPVNNNAEWFYGRTHDEHGNRNNSFWDVLPIIYDEESLIDGTPTEWKRFCTRNHIAITDLISIINDAEPENPDHVNWLGSYSDKVIATKFHDFEYTNIINLLQNNPTINNVYITNGVNGAFWNALWNPVIHYCQINNIRCTKLLTPSKNARFSMFAYNRNNPINQYNMDTLNDYILMKWQHVWHF